MDYALDNGYIDKLVYEDLSTKITREDLAYMINSYLELDSDEDLLEKFMDQSEIIHQDQVSSLVKIGLIDGCQDDTFRPKNLITRAEVSKLVSLLKKNTLMINYRPVSADDLSQFRSKLAILKDDFIVKESYSLVEEDGQTYHYESRNINKLAKNDLFFVFKTQDGMAKLSPALSDYPRPIYELPASALDYNEENIKTWSNQIIIDNANIYDKPQGQVLGTLSSVGQVVERDSGWVLARFFPNMTEEEWIREEDIKTNDQETILDLK